MTPRLAEESIQLLEQPTTLVALLNEESGERSVAHAGGLVRTRLTEASELAKVSLPGLSFGRGQLVYGQARPSPLLCVGLNLGQVHGIGGSQAPGQARRVSEL